MNVFNSWRRQANFIAMMVCASYFVVFTAVAGPSSITVFSPQIDAANVLQTLYFPVTRNGDAGYDINLNYQTLDGSAVAGVDYVATAGAAMLPAEAPGLFLPTTIEPTTVAGYTKTFQLLLDSAVGVGPSPTFELQQDFGSFGAGAPIATDINGDGRPDLVYPRANYLAVRLNTTTPGATATSFSSEQTFVAGNGANFVAVGDVNGDGRPDVVVTDENDNTVSVFLNTTAPGVQTASFSSQAVFSTGNSPKAVALVDINGDGHPDIVVANASDGTVSILLNTTPIGTTAASFSSTQSFATGAFASSVTAADINGDGRPDLIVANTDAQTVSVLVNTSTINTSVVSFAQAQQLTIGWPSDAIATDLNSDGRPDIIATNYSNSAVVRVWTNTTQPGSETVLFSAPVDFSVGQYPTSVVAADLNGDGLPDLEVANSGYAGQSTNFVSVLRNTTPAGAATPSFNAQQTVVTATAASTAIVADLNGDGRGDLIVGGYIGAPTFSTFLNKTPATAAVPSFSTSAQYAAGSSPFSVVTADLNGDGLQDIVAANYWGENVSVLVNSRARGSSVPSFAAQQTFACGPNPDSLTVTDMNGDGVSDIVVGNVGTQYVSILVSATTPGSPVLTFQPAQTVDTGGMLVYAVTAVDLNGDGRKDLAVFGELGINPEMMVFFNTTTPGLSTLSFSPAQSFSANFLPGGATNPSIDTDVNGDGIPDLIFAGSRNVEVFLNQTTSGSFIASFSAPHDFIADDFPNSIAVADLNGDGRSDFALSTFRGLSILLNTTPPGANTASFITGTTLQTGDPQGYANSVVIRDINGDGKPDFLVVNQGYSIVLLPNTMAPGALAVSAGNLATLTSDSSPYYLAVADVTGDGGADLITTNGNNAISVAVNTTLSARIAVNAATGTIVHDEIFANRFE